MLTSNEIRKMYLDFFRQKDHTVVESSSLVPIDDPTLLFTNAGMNQFKDVFLGIDKRNYTRATTSQKCVRAGGKHNDLDTVGRTPRHHTFFEMLGNFSFGDYFKREAIGYAWEFLTEVICLPKERLWITIYTDDDEANQLWQEVAGVTPDRIIRLGEKDNFWSMGDTGPCGPCSEIMYDRGQEFACSDNCALGVCDCDRWLEIWNLVFMQYNRDKKGELTPLPKPSIDTGMGLERLTSILQGVNSNFDTDLFVPIMKQIEELTGKKYDRGEEGFPFRVIADHSRACTFLIGDGVLPSNDGRGYVLRRILRRAVRFGRLLGIEEPFLYKNVDIITNLMSNAYPELSHKKEVIKELIKVEEERFFITLNEGLKKVSEFVDQVTAEGGKVISGEAAFMLYDTYGFPLDLTEDVAGENKLEVDKDTFNQMMEEQRNRARNANKGGDAFARERLLSELLVGIEETIFTGYDVWQQDSTVLALIKDDKLVDKVNEGEIIIVTSSTPFYAESGGQVADCGLITGEQGEIVVNNVQKVAGWIVHYGQVSGEVKKGEKVSLQIDLDKRMATARNHTATHLLHKALRMVLGDHAQQKGSLVEPSRLRFDFAHLSGLDNNELVKIENIVNNAIWKMNKVNTVVTDINEARNMGAIALFGEKYGEKVRVVQIGDFSLELCGGTHVSNTGQIGPFKIISESSIGSGLRRIEAITGGYAMQYFNKIENQLKDLASSLRTNVDGIGEKISAMEKKAKENEKEIENLKMRLSSSSSEELINKAIEINGAQVLIEVAESEDLNALRGIAEKMKDKLGSAVVLLGANIDNKVSLVCFVSKDLVKKGLHAGKIVGAAAKIAGGGGGGRPDMAQAGGKDTARLNEAIDFARDFVKKSFS